MEDRIETGWLFGFYGPLLTERQRVLLSLWCEEDLSLSEIAARENISRQGVYDTVRAAQKRLRELEASLGMLGRWRRLTDGLEACLAGVREIPGERAREVEARLARLIEEEEEDDGL